MLTLLITSLNSAKAINSPSTSDQQACCEHAQCDTAVFDDGEAEIAEMIAEGERILLQRQIETDSVVQLQPQSFEDSANSCCL